ncbi:MAG: M6 family metalloprotease domain-containing protein, partial [Elusimicrobiaceae bacterium]|nr:M6 family metalloprotease domain-containing protein [Elusimicrobiaceae bacterium]
MENAFLFLIRRFAALTSVLAIFSGGLFALAPPRPGEIDRLKTEGALKEHIAYAKAIGNNRVSNGLLQRYKYNMQKLAGKTGLSATPPPAWQNMPTTGNVKLLVVPIRFSGTDNHFTQAELVTEYEKLITFYKQSSYGQLNFSVTVLPWYTYAGTRASIPTTTAGRQAVINEALAAQNANYDYSEFDNDGNGSIDLFLTLWAGTPGGWSTFWWAYQTSYSGVSNSYDGVTLDGYVWQWEYYPEYYPLDTSPTFISNHEVGHGLGLPDYYDYDDEIGPGGGIGGGDMMADNTTDHNAFSKFLLGWITPSVYTSGTSNVTLSSQGVAGQALQIMPTAASGTSWDEYYMAEYRQASGIDEVLPTTGVYLWHVDARLDLENNNYYYENSFSRHKLLKRVEADGNDSIENNSESVSAGSVYTNGATFSPSTTPNSKNYQGLDTGIKIGPLVSGTNQYTVPVSVLAGPAITDLSAANGTATGEVALSWTVPAGVSSYDIAYATWTAVASYPMSSTLGTGWTLESSNGTTGNWYISGGALQSGDIARDSDYYGYSTISRTITGPGTLNFSWKVSSEENYDFLNFLVDGTPVYRISGTTDWSAASYVIAAGDHLITWEYAKDSSASGGADKSYLRNVTMNYSDPEISWPEATKLTTATVGAAGSAQTYTVTGLNTAYYYYFAVRTKTAAGAQSEMSNTAEFQPAEDLIAPAAVSDLAASGGPSANQITLHWTAPGDDGTANSITGGKFELRYASHSAVTAGNNTLVSIATSAAAGSAQTYTVTITSEPMTYWFALWTYDSDSNASAVSNIATASVLRDTAAPAAVTDFAVQPTAAEGQLKFSWTAPGADGSSNTITDGEFIIRYSSTVTDITITNGTELVIATTAEAGSEQQYILSNLVYGATYYAALWTRDVSDNLSDESNQAHASPYDEPPAAPASLSSSTSAGGTVTLSWPASVSPDRSYYRIYADTT